ncbi:hypothetical protein LTR08_006673 [Meristemomyces frigidus]|nr:hypothetical protein LTR08_006673 [Meristemomyces frigidus]
MDAVMAAVAASRRQDVQHPQPQTTRPRRKGGNDQVSSARVRDPQVRTAQPARIRVQDATSARAPRARTARSRSSRRSTVPAYPPPAYHDVVYATWLATQPDPLVRENTTIDPRQLSLVADTVLPGQLCAYMTPNILHDSTACRRRVGRCPYVEEPEVPYLVGADGKTDLDVVFAAVFPDAE